jgi:hypothetical protein
VRGGVKCRLSMARSQFLRTHAHARVRLHSARLDTIEALPEIAGRGGGDVDVTRSHTLHTNVGSNTSMHFVPVQYRTQAEIAGPEV